MRNVFFDANVIIDWLVSSSINHSVCTKAINLSLNKSRHSYISPTTIAITSYFLYKQFKSEKKVKTMAQQIYEPFRITTENEETVKLAMSSKFTDIEDAIQYHSALNQGIDVIITQNTNDFSHSKIAILTPEEFCQMYELAR
ncbi:MAG: PIN domain-containing protein [Bacteroidota bacterium]